jgi:hypothetical protein
MKLKRAFLPRIIKARLEERYIFNFRLRPEDMERHLPVKWLKPQVINGWSVVSFCILDISKVTIAPIPNIFNFRTISCAYRCGVIDLTTGNSTPSVYITDRNADLPLITKLAPILLLDSIPAVKTSIGHEGDLVRIQTNYTDGQTLFSAEVLPGKMQSELFASLDEFKLFIKNGESSYTPSIHSRYMTRVDLKKDDTFYEHLNGEVEYSWLDGPWKDTGLILDSIVRAKGGGYTWTYRGLMPYE